MPVMHGFETIGQVRADICLAQLPAIAMTASASIEARSSYPAEGMDGFISKPFDPALLNATLAKWQRKPVDASIIPQISAIELSVLTRWIGDNKIKLKQFAVDFMNSARLDVIKIESALQAVDFAALTSLAHHASSPAQMVVTIHFADLCRILEAHTYEEAAGDEPPILPFKGKDRRGYPLY